MIHHCWIPANPKRSEKVVLAEVDECQSTVGHLVKVARHHPHRGAFRSRRLFFTAFCCMKWTGTTKMEEFGSSFTITIRNVDEFDDVWHDFWKVSKSDSEHARALIFEQFKVNILKRKGYHDSPESWWTVFHGDGFNAWWVTFVVCILYMSLLCSGSQLHATRVAHAFSAFGQMELNGPTLPAFQKRCKTKSWCYAFHRVGFAYMRLIFEETLRELYELNWLWVIVT